MMRCCTFSEHDITSQDLQFANSAFSSVKKKKRKKFEVLDVSVFFCFPDVCRDAADVKPQEEEEEDREDKSPSENGMQCTEGVTDPRTCAAHTQPHTPTHILTLVRVCVCVFIYRLCIFPYI